MILTLWIGTEWGVFHRQALQNREGCMPVNTEKYRRLLQSSPSFGPVIKHQQQKARSVGFFRGTYILLSQQSDQEACEKRRDKGPDHHTQGY